MKKFILKLLLSFILLTNLIYSQSLLNAQGIIIDPQKKDPNFYTPSFNGPELVIQILPFKTIDKSIGMLYLKVGRDIIYLNYPNKSDYMYMYTNTKFPIFLETHEKYYTEHYDQKEKRRYSTIKDEYKKYQLQFKQFTCSIQNHNYEYFFGLTADNKIYYTLHCNSKCPENLRYDGWESWWREMKTEGHFFKQIIASENTNGTILLTGLATDGAVYYNMQLSSTDISEQGWTGWKTLYGTNLKQIVCETGIGGRIVLFALSNDGSVYHIWQTEAGSLSWSNWAPLGGSELQKIVVKSNADGRLALFALGGDYRVYEIEQTSVGGSWTDWTTLNGNKIIDITSEISGGGRLTIFALTGVGAIEHVWQWNPGGTAWSGWTPLGSGFRKFSTCQLKDGSMSVFAETKNGEIKIIQQQFPDGSWGEWQ